MKRPGDLPVLLQNKVNCDSRYFDNGVATRMASPDDGTHKISDGSMEGLLPDEDPEEFEQKQSAFRKCVRSADHRFSLVSRLHHIMASVD